MRRVFSAKKGLGALSLAATLSLVWVTFHTNDNRIYDDTSTPIFDGKTMAEIEAMPKKDRPDLGLAQNLEMIHEPSSDNVPVERTMRAFDEIKANAAKSRAIEGVSWQERGPNNVGGRTRALMFDPNDPSGDAVWAAGVAGGLWYNSNITSSSSQWQNVDDFWANLAITTIAADPSNSQNFYIGTGEGFFNADAVRGAGLWKSSNGGSTWTQLSSTTGSDFYYVQKVAVSPTGTIIAATREGLFRSTNGGSSWSQLFTGRYADVEIASNGDIYASEGIFSAGAVRKSTNDGVSWTTVTPASGGERIELAIAPSDPNVVYAIASNNTTIAWFRKTTNGGSSWSNVDIPRYRTQSCTQDTQDFARGQAWYDLTLAVSPGNSNVAIVGGIDLYRTSNGGSSWNLISYWTGACDIEVHADQHAIVFSPFNSSEVIFGNDGGVYYSSNAGTSSNPSIVARNNGYNVTQFYGADQANISGSNLMIAGAQDNGSQRFNSAGINSTVEVSGGDGAFCHIDQNSSTYQFTQYVYNSFYRSTNGGSSFSSILQNQTYGRFINPTDYDDDAKVMYSAANADQYIYLNNLTGSVGAFIATAPMNGGQASAIKVSPNTNDRIFIGTGGDGGSAVFRIDNSNNSSPTVTQISTSALPADGYISSIDIGSSDNQLIVTYSNYGITSVWETRNGGASWSNREGNLPDIPVRWALYNPDNTDEVLLATELGVWSTDNIATSSPEWGVTNTGLANVRCDMLQYREADGTVMVVTHGRGLYTGQPFSAAASDTEAPTSPAGLTASNVSTSSFDISWNASSDNVGVTGYNVFINGSLAGSTASTSYSFSGLSASTSYAIAVEAEDAAGNVSGQGSINVSTDADGISCSTTITSFPYNESFEGGPGSWSQASGDDGNWVNYSGSTPSGSTGPSGASDGTFYYYLEASTNNTPGQIGNNATAILDGPCLDLTSAANGDVSFDYHMYGSNMGSLRLEATTDGTSYSTLWSLSGDQGNSWQEEVVSLSSYLGSVVALRFVGTTGSSWQSDLAIDNVSVFTSGAADTEAPSAPSSLVASNVTQTSFDLNWNASTDNVGVTGYQVSVNGSVVGSTASTSFGVSGLNAGTSYSVSVVAFDAAGNVSASLNGNVSTQSSSVVLLSTGFDTGLEGWTDGGADCFWYQPGTNYIASNSVVLRDDSNSSLVTSPTFNASGYANLEVEFAFYFFSMESGERLFIEYFNGSSWNIVGTYTQNGNPTNNVKYTASVDISSSQYTLATNARIRFRLDGSTDSDYSFVDDVVVTANSGGAVANLGGTFVSDGVASPLSVAGDLQVEIDVYPNPAVDELRINNLIGDASMRIVTMSGSVINVVARDAKIDVSNLETGVYFLEIMLEDETQMVKFIKK